MKIKLSLIATGAFFLFFLAIVPLLSGCNQSEIKRLETERDVLQKDRAVLQKRISDLELERQALSNSLSFKLDMLRQEISAGSNRFELERITWNLTNNFLNAEVEHLKSELSTQLAAIAEGQQRAKDNAKREPVENGLKALKKIASATEIGVNAHDYSQLLIESNEAVQEAIKGSMGEFSSALKSAYGAFSDANNLWQDYLNPVIPSTSGLVAIFSESGREICTKYGLGRTTSSVPRIYFEDITSIWKQAQKYVKQADDAFAKEARNP